MYYDSLIRKQILAPYKIAIDHRSFDMIKYKNQYMFLKVEKRTYTQRELEIIESIVGLENDKILSENIVVPNDINEIYDVFLKYSWYSLMLKYVFSMRLNSKILKYATKYIRENIEKLPSHNSIQTLKMIVEANKINISAKAPTETLRMVRPLARMYGEEIVKTFDIMVDTISKRKKVTLELLLDTLKSEKVSNLMEFIKKLAQKNYIEIIPK